MDQIDDRVLSVWWMLGHHDVELRKIRRRLRRLGYGLSRNQNKNKIEDGTFNIWYQHKKEQRPRNVNTMEDVEAFAAKLERAARRG